MEYQIDPIIWRGFSLAAAPWRQSLGGVVKGPRLRNHRFLKEVVGFLTIIVGFLKEIIGFLKEIIGFLKEHIGFLKIIKDSLRKS